MLDTIIKKDQGYFFPGSSEKERWLQNGQQTKQLQRLELGEEVSRW